MTNEQIDFLEIEMNVVKFLKKDNIIYVLNYLCKILFKNIKN